jgi:hypothetical protein
MAAGFHTEGASLSGSACNARSYGEHLSPE